MLKIKFSPGFMKEKTYVIGILLEEFLGIQYENIIDEKYNNYEIELENGNKLIINDAFFGKQDVNHGYLTKENIPKKVNFGKNSFLSEYDIPIIYGDDRMTVSDGYIICGIDIISSVFFMLTRWEEYVGLKDDIHGRFCAFNSLAYNCQFLSRPVVDEYCEMLWNMLKYLSVEQQRKITTPKLILTHDIDRPLKWNGVGDLMHSVLGDLLKRGDLRSIGQNMLDFASVTLKMKKDPYDTFDDLMRISEAHGIKSVFLFMSGGKTKYDSSYSLEDDFIIRLLSKIHERGHVIGFHPSYESAGNREIWTREYIKLCEAYSNKVNISRQHYLRINIPLTWQVMEDNGVEFDSTLGYADLMGFRCGTCKEYSLFNIENGNKLNVRELPLLFMEDTVLSYSKKNPVSVQKEVDELMALTKKYHGNFVMLWHNSNFNSERCVQYKSIYTDTIRKWNKEV